MPDPYLNWHAWKNVLLFMIGKAFEAGIYILAQYATCFAFHKDCFARLSQSASNFSDFLSIIISQCKVKKSF